MAGDFTGVPGEELQGLWLRDPVDTSGVGPIISSEDSPGTQTIFTTSDPKLYAGRDGVKPAGEPGDTEDSVPKDGSGHPRETPTPYDQQDIMETYVTSIEGVLKGMADDFQSMGESDLHWQAEVIRSLVAAVRVQPELAFPLLAETRDLKNKLLERRNREAKHLGTGATTGNSTSAAGATNTGGRSGRWDRLTEIFISKLDPEIWKLIAHLRTPKEWGITGKVSANAFFVQGEMGISITFGE